MIVRTHLRCQLIVDRSEDKGKRIKVKGSKKLGGWKEQKLRNGEVERRSNGDGREKTCGYHLGKYFIGPGQGQMAIQH